MHSINDRIVIDPTVRSGKPVIRGTRIAVSDVLEYLAGGMTPEEILADFPDLRADDIRAALGFAAERERRLFSYSWDYYWTRTFHTASYPHCSAVFAGSTHLRNAAVSGADDEHVWEYAKAHDLVLTTKDTDFYQRSILRGAPPKVIWVRVGNAPTAAIARLLLEQHSVIRRFVNDHESTFLALGSLENK
jgi:uncharacterized protein (DUF433 family)/predicted nuclease of predicted toxin-antitoxin system